MDYQSVSRRFVFLLIRFMDFGADVAIVVLLILLRAKGVCVLGVGGGGGYNNNSSISVFEPRSSQFKIDADLCGCSDPSSLVDCF